MGYIALSPASQLPANDLKTDVINELMKLKANLLPLMLLKAGYKQKHSKALTIVWVSSQENLSSGVATR